MSRSAEGIDGLIHISDMSWSKRLQHPSEMLKKGDEIEAMVLNLDAENQRLSLGLKQLATDIWDDFFANNKVGDIVQGKVVRVTNFGAFVELAEGIEGLIHVSEFDDGKGEKVEVKVDETIKIRIIQAQPGRPKDRAQHPGAQDGRLRNRLAELRGQRVARGHPRRPLQAQPDVRIMNRSGTLGDGENAAGGSMTKAALVEEVARVADLTKKHSEVIVDTVFRSIIDALHRGEKIELRGFGSFRLRRREPRKGRNPKTGDKVDVPSKRVPYFKPGKELKELINSNSNPASAEPVSMPLSDTPPPTDSRFPRF